MEDKDWERVERLTEIMGAGDFLTEFIKALPTDIVRENLDYIEMNQGLPKIDEDEDTS